MSPTLYHEFAVTLQRNGPNVPWGFRLAGGSDLNAPLIVIRVQQNSPAQKELLRGDILTKVEDFDARDLRHEDAQMLFKTADNQIRLVVRRDNKIAMQQSKNNPISSLPPTPAPTFSPMLSPSSASDIPHRAPSPLPHGPHSMAVAYANPIEALPHTVFPHEQKKQQQPLYQQYQPPQQQQQQQQQAKYDQHINFPPPAPVCFSPQLTRDNFQETEDGTIAIHNQPYRTTPLILPGAKVKKDQPVTECYLRHHPNPQMRSAPTHEYAEVLMKQKVADSVLQRVVGEEAATGKVVHKQFNSPIGLYSDSNIENTIKSTVSPAPSNTSTVPSMNGTLPRTRPTKIQGYKKTVVYDPLKSETYRALVEQQWQGSDKLQEVPVQQSRTFHPNRIIPAKKPNSSFPPPDPQANWAKNVNSLGENNETIHQSGSFKRLMYSVLGETEY